MNLRHPLFNWLWCFIFLPCFPNTFKNDLGNCAVRLRKSKKKKKKERAGDGGGLPQRHGVCLAASKYAGNPQHPVVSFLHGFHLHFYLPQLFLGVVFFFPFANGRVRGWRLAQTAVCRLVIQPWMNSRYSFAGKQLPDDSVWTHNTTQPVESTASALHYCWCVDSLFGKDEMGEKYRV